MLTDDRGTIGDRPKRTSQTSFRWADGPLIARLTGTDESNGDVTSPGLAETGSASASLNWPLLALAFGTFGIGTTEFAPMGFLPIIADGVHVSIPTAGLLVSAYAIGVMIGAPLMTLLLGRMRMRTALVVLLGIFTIGNLLSALSPTYGMLLAARVFTSLGHGAFIGLGSVAAASMVAKERRASAVAIVFMGLTVANIGGVPAATWIGQQVGWRVAFAGMAGWGLLSIAILRMALPQGVPGTRPDVRREVRVLARPDVLIALATSVLGSSAMFELYTYIAPILSHLTNASNGFVTLALVMVGIGFTIGNGLGGRLADWSLDGATCIILIVLALVMAALPLVLGSEIGAATGLLVWGAASFAIVPPMQTRVMQAASEAPGLASSINAGAFNLGNALGAAVGGQVISFHLGYEAIPLVGSILALAGLAIVLAGRGWVNQRNDQEQTGHLS